MGATIDVPQFAGRVTKMVRGFAAGNFVIGGVVLAVLVPVAAELLQFDTAGPLTVIALTVVCLHIISANFMIPKIIGSRVRIGPVAATAGILFWGWLWGLMGILLAVPLTAFVKIVADCHPSLFPISNLLAESPRRVSPWIHSGRETLYKTVPFIRKRFPAKFKI